MPDPKSDSDSRCEADDDLRWAEAARRVRFRLENGPQVRGISTQAGLLILIVLVGALGILARIGDPVTAGVVWQFAILAAAFVVGAIAYIRAKRGGHLLPQIPLPRSEQMLSPLHLSERRALARQLRGREVPTERSRALVLDLIAIGRANNRAAWPLLVGMFLFLLSESVFLGWPWPLAIVGVTVFILVMTLLETRWWRRAVSRSTPTGHPPRAT